MEPIIRQKATCTCCERELTVYEAKPADYTCTSCSNHCPMENGECRVRMLISPPTFGGDA